jgi:DNA-binding HxlR family transcriptional regulator
MRRRYHQYCPVARALDVVGERWTMLIVRELRLGPRRFTDLAAGVPGIGTSVLTARLKQLEQDGLVAKRTLPAPAASVVYELTDDAVGLVAILRSMANWGNNLLGQPRPDDHIQGHWLVLGLAVTAEPAPTLPDAAYELRIDDDTLHIQAHSGHLYPFHGPASDPAATIIMSSQTLTAIASGALEIPSRRADKLIAIDGNPAHGQRLLESLSSSTRQRHAVRPFPH